VPRLLVVALIVASSACTDLNGFLPRTHTSSVSPDGHHTAFVRQGLNVDPPDDHLFLSTGGRAARPLMDLAPDADWCKTIIWTPDSRKVGFVVSDDRVAVFDVGTGALEAFFFLVGKGCCGGPQEARHVAFNKDGTEVSFDRFERPTVLIRPRKSEAFEAAVTSESPEGLLTSKWPLHKPAKNLGPEVVRIPVSRIRLRLVAPPGGSLPRRIAVKAVAANERWIEVEATPTADGLVVLPAVDDGPLQRLEIGFFDGSGKRTVVRGVTAGEGATVVTVPIPRHDVGPA